MNNETIFTKMKVLMKDYNEAVKGLFIRFIPDYERIKEEKLKLQAELITELRKIIS